jgi:hypothetical protein
MKKLKIMKKLTQLIDLFIYFNDNHLFSDPMILKTRAILRE